MVRRGGIVRTAHAAGLLIMVLMGASACGEQDSTSPGKDPSESMATPTAEPTVTPSETPPVTPSETPPTTPPVPRCEQIWVDGKRFPNRYTGCTSGDRFIEARKYPCSSEIPFVTFANRFYAMPGHEVVDGGNLKKNRHFKRLLASCQA